MLAIADCLPAFSVIPGFSARTDTNTTADIINGKAKEKIKACSVTFDLLPNAIKAISGIASNKINIPIKGSLASDAALWAIVNECGVGF